MSSYEGTARTRGRTLLIVEGEHERDELFWVIFKCFPEMNIDADNVWVYGTNIYVLYEDIVKEYKSDAWSENGEDIDLPFVISKKKHLNPLCYKADFTNVILVFDYERHDPRFAPEKIRSMQEYFSDETEMGKLYINYPMVESYQDLKSLPDKEYAERTIPASLKKGAEYKNRINEYSVIKGMIDFPDEINEKLKVRWAVQDEEILKKCCNMILNVSSLETIDEVLSSAFVNAIGKDKVRTAICQFTKLIGDMNYVRERKTYFEYMRGIFKQIILHNICKENRILDGQYCIAEGKYKECLDNMDMLNILDKQNEASRDEETGFIWVLNTCVLFVAEYNFSLIEC